MDEHAFRILEFDKVLARLARLTSFSAGRELALALRPATEYGRVVRRQRLTAEARRLRELQPRASVGGARDVRAQADKASRGGVLEPDELLDIASTLAAAGDLRSSVGRLREELPLLGELAGEIEPLPELVAEISRCISPRAEVNDAASPQLGVLRRDVRIAHDRLHSKLQEILHSTRYRDAIQEPIVTLRDGRYVVPVKADQRGQLRGIVHDTSASGATVFVEPLSVVELGNTWRELQLEEEREVQRVLRELSALAGESAEAIVDTIGALAKLDLAFAKASLGDELGAYELPYAGDEQPWLVEAGGALHLLSARHPLLTGDVVATTITVGGAYTVLLVTGPNTGGKTVALKTAGLLALMAQAGLPVAADRGSTVPVFTSIHADIGDEQSIEQSLSTFSSHMTHIIEILTSATSSSLVLLDELAAGTDPIEGSALARAILERLREIGCLTIATTHHGELKAYAHSTDGVMNASVEFDPVTLGPTYRLTIGLPGRSNALAIAERLGLDREVVEEARAFVGPEQAQVDSLLTDIRRERDDAVSARRAEEFARREAEEIRERLGARLDEVETERETLVEKTAGELERDTEAVRELLAQAERDAERGRLQRAAEKLAQAQERAQQVEQRRPPKRPKPKPHVPAGPSPESIQAGDLVWIVGYDRYGEALAPPDDRGEVELKLGPLRSRVRLEQVERVQRPRAGGHQAIDETHRPRLPEAPAPPLEIEIRGQTVDEALPLIDQYLDQAYRAGLPWVRIIHGRGTGTLRRQVRDMLHKHPLARSYETAPREHGGEGVTVVTLAE